ncbi:hypothetical protein [Dolichospermum circinale]|uniref:hypothetical protein n=1 Tax=Dolichospermum circinale TaxID=109265 RepID=UPI00041A6A36|nr:hypothetical protein [Dolichospermum circinale]
MVSQNKCIFLCRIWKIEDIQQLKLFPVKSSLFPAFTDNFYGYATQAISKPYLVDHCIAFSQLPITHYQPQQI